MEGEQLGLVVMGLLGGAFSIAGAVFNWDWFMNNNRARLFVNLFGRDGARVVYVVLGLFLMGIGFFALIAG